MKKEQLDNAWLNMQNRLRQEPDSANWTAFAEQNRQARQLTAERQQGTDETNTEDRNVIPRLSAPAGTLSRTTRTWSARLQRHKRWIAGTAAAIVLGVTLATPAGNHALASLLNQFRMEKLTVVQKQDLDELFNSLGASESTMNQYGEFARATDGEKAVYSTLEELKQNAGRDVVIPAVFRTMEPQNLRIVSYPSRTLTMKVNVKAINEMMRKLGAETLLPLSIDGKQISMSIGSPLIIEDRNKSQTPTYSFVQQPVPYVTVEAGVPLAEALEAVMKFPLIPDSLKQQLQQSHVLDSGSAPLPIVMPNGYEQIRIANTEVLVTGPNATDARYSAVWLKNGQLFIFNGAFSDRDGLMSMLKEMIGS
ncbi:MAG: hypothetical protein K0Q59_377 [Paenibacillus sp.]|jgi:hypothetical protein|nr:hypothetical protein [Paenibacillus sp.]